MKLNLGCGPDIKPGWVNMDLVPLPGVDVVHNMMDTPWPFQDGQFDEVLASHVLEHVPHVHPSGKDGFLAVMEELHRVLQPGGLLVVRVPHYRNRRAYESDPTHTRIVRPQTWDYFSDKPGALNWYTPARFRLERARVTGCTIPRFQPFPYLAYRFKPMRFFGPPGEMTYDLRRV